jgi:hypothetical protein
MRNKVFFEGAATLILIAGGAICAHAANWLQFGYDAAHSGFNQAETGYSTATGNRALYHYLLPSTAGVADSAPVYLGSVATNSGTKNLLFLATKNATLVALNADSSTLDVIWSQQAQTPISDLQVATGSPVIDPSLQYVYAHAHDGKIHKYQVGDGTEIVAGGWPEIATLKPDVEKGAAGLSFATAQDATTYLYSVTGSYGDAGDYQGHLTAINLATGAQQVFNTLCSNLAIHFVENGITVGDGQNDCASRRNGIWGRPGAVYDAGTDRVFITTGNGPFKVDAASATYNWGDSILALYPDGSGGLPAGMPVDSYTPGSFQGLQNTDADLGSVSVAVLKSGALGLQVGKDACVRVVSLSNMSGQGQAGHTGGELQVMRFITDPVDNCATGNDPQGHGGTGADEIKAQPAIWQNPADGSTWAYIVNGNGMVAYQLTIPVSGNPFLTQKWIAEGGTSALVANATVYYMTGTHRLAALDAVTGTSVISNTSSWGAAVFTGLHWQSPILVNGRAYLLDSHSPSQVWVYQLDGVFRDSFQ